jgi:hypothetical protein
MRAAQFLAIIGRGSKGSNALENTEDRAGATSEQQDNVINTVNSLDPYGPSWQLVPGNVAAGTVYAQVPTSGTGDLTFTRASTKTRTNASGNVVDVASGVAAIDYRNADGSLSSTGRLLPEPQRTNSIRNSTMVGAVAGTPGTFPTNYTSNFRGFSSQVVGTGTENGIQYFDLRLFGTSPGGQVEITLESNTQIAALSGQNWAFSSYLKLVAGSLPVGSQVGHVITERTVAGVGLVEQVNTFSLTSSLQRFTSTRTLNQATTAFVNVRIIVTSSTTASDFTIRIAAPQMELGASATTFIRTSTAAVTRLVDSSNTINFSSLIGQTSGTLFVSFNVNQLGAAGAGGNLALTNGVDEIALQFPAGKPNNIRGLVFIGGLFPVVIDVPYSTTGDYKVAFAYAVNNFTVYVNGALGGTDTSGTVPACSQIRINSPLSINQAALFTRRLTNAELAAITTL